VANTATGRLLLRALFGRVGAHRDVETLVVVRNPELSTLEKEVLERLPQEPGQFVVGRDDGSLIRDYREGGLGGRLASLSAAPSVSTLVELRAELMMQGRLR
jgi:hypothetical protein